MSAMLAPLDFKYASRKFAWLNSSAVVYAAFPPVGVGLVPVAGLGASKLLLTPVAELSSQYCSQRSLSRISAAARKLRIAASPFVSLPPLSASAPKAGLTFDR